MQRPGPGTERTGPEGSAPDGTRRDGVAPDGTAPDGAGPVQRRGLGTVDTGAGEQPTAHLAAAPPDDTPLTPPSSPPPADVPPVVVPRWMQVVGLTVALLGVSALVRASRPVLLVFVVAGVIALILNPVVKLLQRSGLPRGAATGLVFLGFFAAVAGTIGLLVNPVADQIQAFQRDLPSLIDSANASLLHLQQSLDQRGLDIQVAGRGETALETVRNNVVRGSGDVLSYTRDIVTLLLEAGFAVVLILVIAIYMLIYGKQIGALVRRVMPAGDGTPEDDYPIRVQKAVFGYVRGQLTFSLIMGVSAGLCLWVFGAGGIFPSGQSYAVFFGAFYGLMELIPYVGPVLGAAPPVLVALFQGEPLTALWLVLLFLVLQQLEGHVVAPQIFSHSLRMNPLVVIFVLLLGGHLHGIVGALIALPVAAVVRETAIYLRRHLVLEPWGTPSAAALATGAAPGPPPVAALPEVLPAAPVAAGAPAEPVRRCPACRATSPRTAEFCWACGSPMRVALRVDQDPLVPRSAAGSGARRVSVRRSALLSARPAPQDAAPASSDLAASGASSARRPRLAALAALVRRAPGRRTPLWRGRSGQR